MIIIRISGGIGNQLFQYALGRSLSLRNKTELKIDTHFYGLNMEPNRSFKLPYFNVPDIEHTIATKSDFRKNRIPNPFAQDIFSKMIRKVFRIIESIKPLYKRKIILEPTFNFIPEIMKITGNCYLAGVWQSEKYFSEFESVIRNDLTLKNPLSEKAQELKRVAESSPSVSVHIRRGDQVNNPILLRKHGELIQEYYSNAIKYVEQAVKNSKLHIFVFSDDIEWVKSNMNFGSTAIYVSEYGIPDYEELFIMSACKHNIIAKSSFSWWGAWLNTNPHKIVIAPKQRFGNASNIATDLIPTSWIEIS